MKTGKKRAIARLKANINTREARMRAKVALADRILIEALVSAHQGAAILQLAGLEFAMEKQVIERIVNMENRIQQAREALK